MPVIEVNDVNRPRAEFYVVSKQTRVDRLPVLLNNHKIAHKVNSFRGPFHDRTGVPVFYICRSKDPADPQHDDFCSLAVRVMSPGCFDQTSEAVRAAFPDRRCGDE